MSKIIKKNKSKPKLNPIGKLDKNVGIIPNKLVFALSFFLTSFILLNYQNIQNKKQVLGVQTSLKKQEIITYEWREIVNQYPDYRNGWLQLAYQYIRSNEIQKAQEALKMAEELDPNNETIKNLEKLLQ